MRLWMKREWVLVTGTAALLLTGCAPRAVERGSEPSPVDVVQTLVEAFNRHDPARMATLVSEDFEYLSVDGKTVSVDATGREALKESMASYFTSVRDVESVIEHATVTGPFVAIRERVSWTTASGRRSQAALGVYEVRNGLVRRVWYYPAVERSARAR